MVGSAIGVSLMVATAVGPSTLTRPAPASPTPAEAPASAATRTFAVRDRLAQLRSWLAASGGHGIWILVWSLVGWGGTALAPFLSEHPFVLMLLAPRALFVALAVDSVALIPFVIAGTLRLAMTDASYFILGRRFSRGDTPRRPRPLANARLRVARIFVRWTDGLCRWLCNHGVKAGTVLFFRPNGKYLAVAGSYGVSARVAGWSSVSGTMLYLASFHLGVGLLL